MERWAKAQNKKKEEFKRLLDDTPSPTPAPVAVVVPSPSVSNTPAFNQSSTGELVSSDW